MAKRVVDALTPKMTGRWRVSTQHSEHVWDLDHGTYMRMPSEASNLYSRDDNVVVRIAEVKEWPRVGCCSELVYDDLEMPDTFSQWRRSSRIVSIERMTDE